MYTCIWTRVVIGNKREEYYQIKSSAYTLARRETSPLSHLDTICTQVTTKMFWEVTCEFVNLNRNNHSDIRFHQ